MPQGLFGVPGRRSLADASPLPPCRSRRCRTLGRGPARGPGYPGARSRQPCRAGLAAAGRHRARGSGGAEVVPAAAARRRWRVPDPADRGLPDLRDEGRAARDRALPRAGQLPGCLRGVAEDRRPAHRRRARRLAVDRGPRSRSACRAPWPRVPSRRRPRRGRCRCSSTPSAPRPRRAYPVRSPPTQASCPRSPPGSPRRRRACGRTWSSPTRPRRRRTCSTCMSRPVGRRGSRSTGRCRCARAPGPWWGRSPPPRCTRTGRAPPRPARARTTRSPGREARGRSPPPSTRPGWPARHGRSR